jgi:tRNA pseudouridine38-40 synthase
VFGNAGLFKSLNSVLPGDIAIKKIETVPDGFHSRYSAKSRTYRYYLTLRKTGFNSNVYHYVKTKFDIDLAKEFCKLLIGNHSFKAFCKNNEDEHDFRCIIKDTKIRKWRTGIIEFEITANRFLHSMVRAIIGVMLKVASGKIELSEFIKKFKKGEQLSIQYAPSNALVLYKINY